MKHTLVLLMALMCLNPLFANQGKLMDNKPSGVHIPLIPTITKQNGKPRMITGCDIEAYYSNGVLTLLVNSDLGDVDIVVTNFSTGDVWYGGVNGMGTENIFIPGDEGYYTIDIYTDNGDYFGEFSL